MGDKDDFFPDNGKFYVNGQPIDIKPTENSLTIDQSDLDALDGYQSMPSQQEPVTMTFEMTATSARQFARTMERELNKQLPRLPRKAKKKCKKTMFLKYPKRISKWMLLNVYAANNKKTWYLTKNGITITKSDK